jgi:hypothetical protein
VAWSLGNSLFCASVLCFWDYGQKGHVLGHKVLPMG